MCTTLWLLWGSAGGKGRLWQREAHQLRQLLCGRRIGWYQNATLNKGVCNVALATDSLYLCQCDIRVLVGLSGRTQCINGVPCGAAVSSGIERLDRQRPGPRQAAAGVAKAAAVNSRTAPQCGRHCDVRLAETWP
eukprot:6491311-Amphidinium_carterae.3